MTNIHSYTKREAKTKEDVGCFDNFSHHPFSYSELEEAKVVEVFYDNHQYAVINLHPETDAGMEVHRLTKKGELNKRVQPIFIWSSHINVIYTEAPEAPVETFEFEGEQFPIRTEEGVKSLCNKFLMMHYGTTIKCPLVISSRMTSTLGYVEHYKDERKPLKVAFAKRLLEYGNPRIIADTVFHEMNHYGLMVATNLPFYDGSKEFENVCRAIGGSGAVHNVGIKYHYHCEKCNFGYGTEKIDGWGCPECNSTMLYMGQKAVFDGTGHFVPLQDSFN